MEDKGLSSPLSKRKRLHIIRRVMTMKFGQNFGNAIRRFGGAMIVPVLLFPFSELL